MTWLFRQWLGDAGWRTAWGRGWVRLCESLAKKLPLAHLGRTKAWTQPLSALLRVGLSSAPVLIRVNLSSGLVAGLPLSAGASEVRATVRFAPRGGCTPQA